jgi:hypothetical protein
MGAKANQAAAQMRRSETEEGAKSEVGLLIRNPLFLSGLMLYWAEGVKDGNSVVFTNSDPNLIALMMSWFRDICKVSESKFRAIVFIHEFQVNENWLMFWRKITKLSKRQFYPPQVKPTIAKKKRNKLYNGTCAIKIYDAMLASRIRGWKQGIIELIHEE